MTRTATDIGHFFILERFLAIVFQQNLGVELRYTGGVVGLFFGKHLQCLANLIVGQFLQAGLWPP